MRQLKAILVLDIKVLQMQDSMKTQAPRKT
ncbi:MAG: hypothetical protein ACI80H_001779 [Pseudoalteromonas distincta]|jgi:hypothetical protein